MPTSNVVFQTLGSWDSSTVTHMGNQIECVAIKLNLQTTQFQNDRPGGVDHGVDIQDSAMLVPMNPTSMDTINSLIDAGNLTACYNNCNELPLFPGEITIMNGSQDLRVVFDDPNENTQNLKVFLEGVEITQDLCEIQCEINYIENIVTCYVTITDERRLLSHDNQTIKIL